MKNQHAQKQKQQRYQGRQDAMEKEFKIYLRELPQSIKKHLLEVFKYTLKGAK